MRARRKRRTLGFTLVEIMVALAIMMGGLVAVMSMITISTRGNASARAITNATLNTQWWLARLQRMSLRWTTQNQAAVATIPYLNRLAVTATSTGWFVPGGEADTDGYTGLDYQGNPSGVADTRFCTLINLTWITQGVSARAEVITYYPIRSEDPASGGAAAYDCTVGDNAVVPTLLGTPSSNLGSVRAATVLRWSPIGP